MTESTVVRIIRSEIRNFKNVEYGDIKYVNYANAEYRAELNKADINGVYGQNGSGKTAIVEALDILKTIMQGRSVSYDEYAGMMSDESNMVLSTEFYVQFGMDKYKVRYDLELRKDMDKEQIQVCSEKVSYWERGKASWKKERKLVFANPYYDAECLMSGVVPRVLFEPESAGRKVGYFDSIQNLAVLCAQRNISVFFNEVLYKTMHSTNTNAEELYCSRIIAALFDFARMMFQVVKVNQLAANYMNNIIPVNVHTECENEILQGCIPLFINGRGELSEELYSRLEGVVEAINIALKSIISNLRIELEKVSEETNKDGIRIAKVEVYSNRDGKRFLVKYESEGIKRIISLLNYLISLYNNAGICLVVDELDAGVFEYLLGELIGVLALEARGQLIFTSHNLRIMEKLNSDNIICSTVNPKNRFIKMKGIEKNHNKRDFYIRTIVLGGQQERLYDDSNLQDIGYALEKAGGMSDGKVELGFSDEFIKVLNGVGEGK